MPKEAIKYFKVTPGDNIIRILPPVGAHFAVAYGMSVERIVKQIIHNLNTVACEGPGCRFCYMGFLIDISFNERNFISAWAESAD